MSSGGYITSGSGVERTVHCDASGVLPKHYEAGNVYSDGGTEKHAYLERISNGATPAESLELVPEEYRPACEEIDVESMGELKLSAEVTIVYRPESGTARILGQGLSRNYAGVGDDEIPMTLDLVGVDLEAHRGEVVDHKFGWSQRMPAPLNWQIKGGALGLAKVYDLDEVGGTLLLHREGRPTPYRDRAVFGAADLLVAEDDLRRTFDRVLRNRERYARGESVAATEGSWCKYCPSFWECPAKLGAVKAALAVTDDHPITVADVGKVWALVDDGMKALKAVKTRLIAMASVQPLLLGVEPDGTELWLGSTEVEGNERLNAKVVLDSAVEVLTKMGLSGVDDSFRLAASKLEVTKKGLEAAIKDRVPRGQGASTMRAVLKAAESAGGITRPVKHEVDLYRSSPKEG